MTVEATETRVFPSVDALREVVGQPLGVGSWFEMTQDRVDAFAEITGDRQWIHVDPERAAEGPYGTTIAHGFLTLSLIFLLGRDIFQIRGVRMGLNYGINRLRFPNPVRVGSRIRALAHLESVQDVPSGVQVVVRYVIEIEGQDKPACVVDFVRLLVV